MTPSTSSTDLWPARWQHFSAAAVRGYHGYANWLVGISWRRFIVLALALMIGVAIVHDSPPFTWTVTEQIEARGPRVVVVPQKPQKPQKPSQAPKAPVAPTSPAEPTAPVAKSPRGPIHIETPGKGEGVEINIGRDGISITPKAAKPADSAAAAEAAASAASQGVQITLPPGITSDAVREALEEARKQLNEDIRVAREDAEQSVRDATEAQHDAEKALAELTQQMEEPRSTTRKRRVGIGDELLQFTFLWIAASGILKGTYKGRIQAEVKAAQATETAEAESLKRQVVEARMAAMQAQVEPHFLFNTLASIDHLIETDPARASVMQKNLIALLRASMPTMREASDGGVRDLGRELAVIKPYLEILKVRMEERLTTELAVPDGLLSAEFPPMMIQTLVENAIKHGLEPKAEGGLLRLAAEIVHGKLQVTVADTGLGFGKAATAGTGVGLANIRERLQLLYGPKASLTVAANQPSGTVVTITVPYKTIEGAGA